jgi:excisionase family DNA binding protein
LDVLNTKHLYDPDTGAKLLTVREAAEYLSYHPFSLYRLVMQGALKPHRKAGRSLLFLKEELDRFKLTNAWAARKASLEKPSDRPEEPTPDLTADVEFDGIVLPVLSHKVESIAHFTWDKIPLIRAMVDRKYGDRRFAIKVKSPDGGLWTVSYEPPTWIEKIKRKLKKKKG